MDLEWLERDDVNVETEMWNDLDGLTNGYDGDVGCWEFGKRDTIRHGLRLCHETQLNVPLPPNSICIPPALRVDQLTETVSPSRRETSTLR